MDERTEMDILLHDLRKSYIFNTTGPRWGEKFIHHKANNHVTNKMNLCGRLPGRKFPSSWPPMLIQIITLFQFTAKSNQITQYNI